MLSKFSFPFIVFLLLFSQSVLPRRFIPLSELTFQLPSDWKLELRGNLRNKIIKKYLKKNENIFMWSQKLEVLHHYRTLEADPLKYLEKEMADKRLLCSGATFQYDPGAGLGTDGAIAQYVCPRHYRLKKGQLGIVAFIQGKHGLYQIHWLWQGPTFTRPRVKIGEKQPPIKLPLTEKELEVWYKFFASIKLKKVGRPRQRVY